MNGDDKLDIVAALWILGIVLWVMALALFEYVLVPLGYGIT